MVVIAPADMVICIKTYRFLAKLMSLFPLNSPSRGSPWPRPFRSTPTPLQHYALFHSTLWGLETTFQGGDLGLVVFCRNKKTQIRTPRLKSP